MLLTKLKEQGPRCTIGSMKNKLMIFAASLCIVFVTACRLNCHLIPDPSVFPPPQQSKPTADPEKPDTMTSAFHESRHRVVGAA